MARTQAANCVLPNTLARTRSKEVCVCACVCVCVCVHVCACVCVCGSRALINPFQGNLGVATWIALVCKSKPNRVWLVWHILESLGNRLSVTIGSRIEWMTQAQGPLNPLQTQQPRLCVLQHCTIYVSRWTLVPCCGQIVATVWSSLNLNTQSFSLGQGVKNGYTCDTQSFSFSPPPNWLQLWLVEVCPTLQCPHQVNTVC